MDDWKATRRENDARLAALAPRLAAELGPDWHAESVESSSWIGEFTHYLTGPAGARLRIDKADTGDRMTRVQVLGLYPGHPNVYRSGSPSINVGADRPVPAIARDVTRRLLADYLPALAELQRKIADAEAAALRRHARRDRIRELLGKSSLIPHQQSDSSSTIHLDLSMGYGSIKLTGDGSTGGLELSSVPLETVVLIAALLGRREGALRSVA